MPFEPAPKVEAPAKVSEFQEFADAMLRGCAVTGPCRRSLADGNGNTCALGAALVGGGFLTSRGYPLMPADSFTELPRAAYFLRYGRSIESDNDTGRFTREQIAARIAAL